jgi:hypothetical protein
MIKKKFRQQVRKIGAIYLSEKSDEDAKIVEINDSEDTETIKNILGNTNIASYCNRLKEKVDENSDKFEYTIYCISPYTFETDLNLEYNLKATTVCGDWHGFFYGPVILVSTDPTHPSFTMEDWREMWTTANERMNRTN